MYSKIVCCYLIFITLYVFFYKLRTGNAYEKFTYNDNINRIHKFSNDLVSSAQVSGVIKEDDEKEDDEPLPALTPPYYTTVFHPKLNNFDDLFVTNISALKPDSNIIVESDMRINGTVNASSISLNNKEFVTFDEDSRSIKFQYKE